MIEKCTEIGAGRMMPIVLDRTEGEALIALVGTGGKGSWARDDDHYCYGDDDGLRWEWQRRRDAVGQTCASIDQGVQTVRAIGHA